MLIERKLIFFHVAWFYLYNILENVTYWDRNHISFCQALGILEDLAIKVCEGIYGRDGFVLCINSGGHYMTVSSLNWILKCMNILILFLNFTLKKVKKLLTLPINEYFFKKIIYDSEKYRSNTNIASDISPKYPEIILYS